jgi:hypothetical protein
MDVEWALVAHTTPVREDLGSILTQTQDGIFNVNTLISLLSGNRVKTNFIHL